MSLSNPCFKAALDYLAYGLCPIPCTLTNMPSGKVNKKPLVNWSEYQDRLPDDTEIIEWWTRWPYAQVGLVTGTISRLFAIDLDIGYSVEQVQRLSLPKNTPISRTPSGGWHIFMQYPTNTTIRTCADLLGHGSHIDVRGSGGFIVVSPSTYPDGRPYSWVKSPDVYQVAPAPSELLTVLNPTTTRKNYRDQATGVATGARNHTAAQMIGILVHYLPERHWGTVAWPMLQGWNRNNNPPLDDEELFATYNSICNKSRFEKARIRNYTTPL